METKGFQDQPKIAFSQMYQNAQYITTEKHFSQAQSKLSIDQHQPPNIQFPWIVVMLSIHQPESNLHYC